MILNNKITWTGAIAAVIAFGNQILPVLPPVWANLISALFGVYALYHTAKVVGVARAMGLKGI